MQWDAPRPNDNQYNALGMPKYAFRGPLGDADPERHDVYQQQLTAPVDSDQLPYRYNTPYTFQVKPFSDQFPVSSTPTPWAYISCTTPGFRPDPPVAAIVQILDRKVVINWTAPSANGGVIDEYLYEMCKEGSSCTMGGPGTNSWNNRRYMCEGCLLYTSPSPRDS